MISDEISRFPYNERPCMPGSPTAPGRTEARDSAPVRVAFRQQNCVGTRVSWISRLNGWPARSPTDASTSPSRVTPHGSGPMWVATPSSQWTCTTYSLPVSRRTLLSIPKGHSAIEVYSNGTLAWDTSSVPLGSIRVFGTTPFLGSRPLWSTVDLKCMCGRLPRRKGLLTFGAAVGCGHVSGLFMRLMTAGPDAIRSLAPNQFHALS